MMVFSKLKCCTLKICIILILIFGISTTIVTADTSTINVDPLSRTISTGESFTFNVYCIPGQPIKAFELKLSFDPSLLQINSVTEGDFFNGYETFFNSGTIDNTGGIIDDIYNLIIGPGNVSDPGNFVVVNCTAKDNSGISSLDLYEVGATDEAGFISISVDDGSATIEGVVNDDPPGDGGSSGGGGGSSGGGGGYVPPSGGDGDQNNSPETPIKPSGPTYIEMGVEYVYSSLTYDIDGDQIRYKFDWGDGTYSNWSEYMSSNETISMIHSWNSISTFEIKVMAQDENNSNSSWSPAVEVTVSQVATGDIPPVADINYSINESDDLTVEFNASGSFDPDENIAYYLWDFGDGTNGTGISIIHTYSNAGPYTVTLELTDNNSNILYSKSIVVNVGSEFEEKSDEKSIPLIYIVIGIIGTIVGIFICMLVFFRDNVSYFISQNITNRFTKSRSLGKIEKLDLSIQELKRKQTKTDIEKFSDKKMGKKPVEMKYYRITHKIDDIKSESLKRQERPLDHDYIHKKIEDDYISSIEQKIDNIIISKNKEDYNRK